MKRTLSCAVAAAGVTGALLMAPASAQAYTQSWSGTATYRSSYDFLPSQNSVSIGGKGCGTTSSATFFVQLKKTSSQSVVVSGGKLAADGQWRGGTSASVSRGVAYYATWRNNTGSSTCQGVQVLPTE